MVVYIVPDLTLNFDIVGVIGSSPTNPTNTLKQGITELRGFSFCENEGSLCNS